MRFKLDEKTKEYFAGRVRQVFLYLTDYCNMWCKYCLYKPNMTYHLFQKDIPINIAKALVETFRELGAVKLTIMGGEPTIYLRKHLLDLIKYSKDIGYEYIRIDTNGMFEKSLLYEKEFRMLDEITFSIDSHKPEVNDNVRVGGRLEYILENISEAIKLGYPVQITATVHKANVNHIIDFIKFLESIGVKFVNFHPLFRMGVPRDNWIPDNLFLDPEDWIILYRKVEDFKAKERPSINIRIPMRLIKRSEFERMPEYYSYCPERLGERALIHPNGIIRVCALMIGTPYGVAFYDPRKMEIKWNDTITNELLDNQEPLRPCPKQKGLYHRDYYPLCISFKPKQKEIIYEKYLRWEEKRRSI